ncbi:uncharacterized protein K441DRAFT_677452 [Cenococcum geophilum 1.58]|uniref:uncharacterized protein n=1 Tax=Cenococcum geophilum 1.58 TaxID=794803 RepID=UPI00358E8DA9|nr:hypothetical protein K441DRAFT_677452 [Cenococcum geophilum 1.58]
MPSLPPCLPAHPPLPAVPTSLRVGLLPQRVAPSRKTATLPTQDCKRRSPSTLPTDSPPTAQGGVQTPRPVFPSLRCLDGFDMLNLTGECIHRQTSQDNGISNTQVRIELAAWLMIDEQEIKLSSPRLCGCRLLPRIYSPTLQQSTHAPASLIQQPQEAAFGILPSETSVIVIATPGTSEDQLLELEASKLRVGSLAKQPSHSANNCL